MSDAREVSQSKGTANGWAGRVSIVGGDAGFAYAPHDVLTTGGEAALEVARRLYPDAPIEPRELKGTSGYRQLVGVPDPLRLIAELKRAGVTAQPNHVVFAHDCGCCCPPHPALLWGAGGMPHANPMYASPMYASPMYASPMYASPMYASPMYASPMYASPMYASGRRPSSARPAEEPWVTIAADRLAVAAAASPTVPVVVLDTGLAMAQFHSAAVGSLLSLLDCPAPECDQPDDDADLDLDPAAGHGTFIAGLIEQIAPGAVIALRRVLHAEGDGDEVQIAAAIDALPDPPAGGALLNLSFGGYSVDEPGVLAAAVANAQDRGYVVVASAGNDGTCRPTIPASLPGVVSVGAVGPTGPAPFTNFGAWVRACAPGVDLVSTFFAGWNGDAISVDGDGDPDDYSGWACWSGTSFAAPVVVGALAREMAAAGVSATDAVTRLIDNPALFRIPGLGTVVNVL